MNTKFRCIYIVLVLSCLSANAFSQVETSKGLRENDNSTKAHIERQDVEALLKLARSSTADHQLRREAIRAIAKLGSIKEARKLFEILDSIGGELTGLEGNLRTQDIKCDLMLALSKLLSIPLPSGYKKDSELSAPEKSRFVLYNSGKSIFDKYLVDFMSSCRQKLKLP
ncbi:MAG: hypothetical protein ACAI35_19305 [Candidatus Methylacidiphilales bacterium]